MFYIFGKLGDLMFAVTCKKKWMKNFATGYPVTINS